MLSNSQHVIRNWNMETMWLAALSWTFLRFLEWKKLYVYYASRGHVWFDASRVER
jgi:hypothetical protein